MGFFFFFLKCPHLPPPLSPGTGQVAVQEGETVMAVNPVEAQSQATKDAESKAKDLEAEQQNINELAGGRVVFTSIRLYQLCYKPLNQLF